MEDGAYLNKWTDIGKRKGFFKIEITQAEDVEAFLEDLKRL